MRFVNKVFPQPGSPGVIEGVVEEIVSAEDNVAEMEVEACPFEFVVLRIDHPEELDGNFINIKASRFNKRPNVGDDVVYCKDRDLAVVCMKISDEPEVLLEFYEYDMRMFGGRF